jgi:hypothetical protein
MHPVLTQMLAVQHVKDMNEQATVARRVRMARRARRGPIMATACARPVETGAGRAVLECGVRTTRPA